MKRTRNPPEHHSPEHLGHSHGFCGASEPRCAVLCTYRNLLVYSLVGFTCPMRAKVHPWSIPSHIPCVPVWLILKLPLIDPETYERRVVLHPGVPVNSYRVGDAVAKERLAFHRFAFLTSLCFVHTPATYERLTRKTGGGSDACRCGSSSVVDYP
ncbi:hypothetical protein BJV74DRAFT_193473 [Russula compacta]|nr:hypothetical protein BJV74DRAFT_193473 [Russula compacta]